MFEEVFVEDRNGEQKRIYLDKYPDECPICHYSILARIPGSGCSHIRLADKNGVQIVLLCPRTTCDALFLANYRYDIPSKSYVLSRCFPVTLNQKPFTEEIQELSPDFVEIYNQAQEAESHQLLRIAGPGFRKSLEFLIKDFLIHQCPTERAKYEKMALGKCIEDHISDFDIKTCAERAVWIGNDETHYLRKITDRDISDLRSLIQLTVNWIESKLITEKMKTNITKPK